MPFTLGSYGSDVSDDSYTFQAYPCTWRSAPTSFAVPGRIATSLGEYLVLIVDSEDTYVAGARVAWLMMQIANEIVAKNWNMVEKLTQELFTAAMATDLETSDYFVPLMIQFDRLMRFLQYMMIRTTGALHYAESYLRARIKIFKRILKAYRKFLKNYQVDKCLAVANADGSVDCTSYTLTDLLTDSLSDDPIPAPGTIESYQEVLPASVSLSECEDPENSCTITNTGGGGSKDEEETEEDEQGAPSPTNADSSSDSDSDSDWDEPPESEDDDDSD